MKKLTRRQTLTHMVGAGTLLSAPLVWAAYPDKPIRIVIPFPGGFTDVMTRLVAQKMSESMGQPVIVEQKPGGEGQVAAGELLRAPIDGYTLMMIHIGTHAINPSLRSKLNYHPEKDFTPLSQLVALPNLLVASPTLGFKAVADLVAAAKAKPDTLFYGSPGNGTTGHLAGELFCARANIKATHVPYKGASEIFSDLVSGRIHFAFDSLAAGGQQARSGKVTGLAVTSEKRNAQFPEFPTMIESGFANWVTGPWFGLAVRNGTPADLVKRLETEVIKAINHPDVKQKLTEMGATVVASNGESFSGFIRKESQHWGDVVRQFNIKPD